MNKTTEALKYDILVLKIAARFLHKAVSAKERCDYWIVKELIAKKEMQLAEPVKQSLTMVAEPAIPEWVDVDDYEEPSVSDGVCGGCAKTAADGWALYCVECWEKAQPVKQEPVAHYKDAPHTIYLQTGCDDPEDCECSFNEWGDTRITRLNDC